MRIIMVKVHVLLRSRSTMSFLANIQWPSSLFETLEPWEFLCSINNSEQRVFMSNTREPLIKYLLRLRCLWFVSSGRLALRVYIWPLPLVFVLRPCVRAPYLTSHLQNETMWDIWTYETHVRASLCPFLKKSKFMTWSPYWVWEKNLTSSRSVGKSSPI